jgi:hypothetical protein
MRVPSTRKLATIERDLLIAREDRLPWWRDRVPLIYVGDQLVAVGDLWIAEEFAARDGADALRIVWEERPQLIAAESG